MRKILGAAFLGIFLPSISWSLNQGPKDPGTTANDTGTGTVAWSNTGNIVSSNDSKATAVLSAGAVSNYITATNFSFSVPTGTIIMGIVVEIEKSGGTFGAQVGASDNIVRLIKGGSITGNNKAGGEWAIVDTYDSYGGVADLWGITFLPGDVNASNFGVALSATSPDGATASIDHIRITVYYDFPNKTQSSGRQTRTAGKVSQ